MQARPGATSRKPGCRRNPRSLRNAESFCCIKVGDSLRESRHSRMRVTSLRFLTNKEATGQASRVTRGASDLLSKPMPHLSALDLAIVVVYILGMTLLGVWFTRAQKDLRTYFVGGRNV